MSIGGVYLGEIVGTAILILLGNGVVANVVLGKTKGQASGWIVITTGWGLAVAMAVYVAGWISGAHINPAVTVGLAAGGELEWWLLPHYLIGQMIGGFIGAVLVYLVYLSHWNETQEPGLKLAAFSTAPAIRSHGRNFLTEAVGTFLLVFAIMMIVVGGGEAFGETAGVDLRQAWTAGTWPLVVGFLVWAIGLSLGGPTGYAINPARDLAPRLAHAVLPIPGKGGSDWRYSWVPIAGPLVGGAIGGVLYLLVSPLAL